MESDHAQQTVTSRLAQSARRAGWPALILAAAMLLFGVAYGWLAITRHLRFNSTGFDLAINEQIVWNTLNGRFFASSLEVNNSFADHFRPLLLLLVPIYALFQTPVTLLLVQTGALAAAAIPLYLLAKHKLQDAAVALALAIVYLLYPTLGFVARFDFHIEVFAIPAFLAAFYALETDRWRWASFWLVIPLLCKESLGLTVAMFGIYALVRWRRVRWGLGWLLGGLFTFWATSFWLLPALRGAPLDTFARYQWLGNSAGEMVTTLFTQPGIVWQHLTAPDRLNYLLQLSLPVGLLNVIGLPELLLAAPGLAINLLADHFCQSTIYCHYAVPVAPFIFIAAILGLYRLQRLLGSGTRWRAGSLILLLLVIPSYARDNPFQEQALLPSALAKIDNAAVVEQALSAVPPGVTVVTTNDYAPHLAQRQGLFIIGIPAQREAPLDPDIVFLNLYDQQFIVCDGFREYVNSLELDRYGVTFRTGGLIVIQRDAGSPEQFQDFILNWNNCAG